MRKYKSSQIKIIVSEKSQIKKEIVTIVIKAFWDSVRKTLQSNKDINIKGFFIIKMKSYYRKRVNENSKVNLWSRKDKKTYDK